MRVRRRMMVAIGGGGGGGIRTFSEMSKIFVGMGQVNCVLWSLGWKW